MEQQISIEVSKHSDTLQEEIQYLINEIDTDGIMALAHAYKTEKRVRAVVKDKVNATLKKLNKKPKKTGSVFDKLL